MKEVYFWITRLGTAVSCDIMKDHESVHLYNCTLSVPMKGRFILRFNMDLMKCPTPKCRHGRLDCTELLSTGVNVQSEMMFLKF
jgi:hypothetical protein